MSKVAEHFNTIAHNYDHYKEKNWYYYKNLKNLFKEFIPPKSKVLEVGCGTGDVLAALELEMGVGIDISEELIKIAKDKHSASAQLSFLAGDIKDFILDLRQRRFDYIFMSDVIEHLEDVPAMIKCISEVAEPGSKLIISMANPLWEPLLMILEKLKLKMPEGPHLRISGEKLEGILEAYSFKTLVKGQRLIFPASIPGFSNFINRHFYRLPLFKKLGLLMFWVCERKP
jgi:ubiquinone/menaquinone biosynthesis C-methylase UbiE